MKQPNFGDVYAVVNVTAYNFTSSGSVELRAIPSKFMPNSDWILPHYNAGLAPGQHTFKWEFDPSAIFPDQDTGKTPPGTYGLKIRICEDECDDTTHPNHSVLDIDTSHTFEVRDESN